MSDCSGSLVLVDGYNQIYRSFYAIPVLSNHRGEPTNALFAMARFLLKLDSDLAGQYGALVMDKGRSERRLDLLPDYKATRPPMPEALRAQIPAIREWAEACGWHVLEYEGQEADDLIAGVVAHRNHHETYIVTHDKDLAQVVQPGVQLVLPATSKGETVLGVAEVEAKYGVRPDQMVDYLALVGDSSDNIDGVPGIGPKTAATLLKTFDSLDRLLADLKQVEKPTVRDKLAAHADRVRRNQELISLDTTLPPTWSGLDGLRRGPVDWTRLVEMARDNDLKSLISVLEKARNEAQNPRLF